MSVKYAFQKRQVGWLKNRMQINHFLVGCLTPTTQTKVLFCNSLDWNTWLMLNLFKRNNGSMPDEKFFEAKDKKSNKEIRTSFIWCWRTKNGRERVLVGIGSKIFVGGGSRWRVRPSASTFKWVRGWKRGREGESERKRVWVCVCVCVREREREYLREWACFFIFFMH